MIIDSKVYLFLQEYCCRIAIDVSHFSSSVDLDSWLGIHGVRSLHGLCRHHFLDRSFPFHHNGYT